MTDTKQKGCAWLMAGYAALQANDVPDGRSAFNRAATFERQRKAALLAVRKLPRIQPEPSIKRPSS